MVIPVPLLSNFNLEKNDFFKNKQLKIFSIYKKKSEIR
jgi:hypothetical protein